MILNPIICIPTYNNSNAIEGVILECLAQTQLPIWVVDDGSDEPVADLLTSVDIGKAIRSGRLKLFRHDHNLGKGAALRTAFCEAVAQGHTHLVSMDGDGQHLAQEIQKLLMIGKEHPWDLVIGKRRMEGQSVPPSSRFGRRVSNYWVDYETGISIADTQSGFRLYPLFHVQNLPFRSRRFDFEIEVLIRLLWRGVRVREVDVDVHYPPTNERITHFHKFWDNARITLVNTIFALISLLRSHHSPREIAFALGVGVYLGCTPLFGLHTLLAALAAIVFRLNFIYLWLGTNVSNPLIAPGLIGLSVIIGNKITGSPIYSIKGFSWDWLIGSQIVGLALGLMVALGTFGFATFLRSSLQNQRPWTGKMRGGRVATWFIRTAPQRLSLNGTYRCLLLIVPYFYLFAPKARRAANQFWRLVSPQSNWFDRQRKVVRQLYWFAMIIVDRVYQSFCRRPLFPSDSTGIENIQSLAASGKGFILLGAHMGGWDMASAALSINGLSDEFHLVQYQAEGISLNKLKGKAYSEHLHFLSPTSDQQTILKIRELLLAGKPIGLMGDRPLGGHFELVPFLKRLAPFDTTPFRIAAACEVPVLFTFGFKGKDRTYHFFATTPKVYRYSPSRSREMQCQEWLKEYVGELELFVRQFPEQWFNFYPFWSEVPRPPIGATVSKERNHLEEELHIPISEEPEWEPGPKPIAESGFRY